jgi:hypothetical protein
MNRQPIIEAIRKHIASRSGIDFRNYGDRASAMEDYRKILRHGKDARAMLRVIELSHMTAEELLAGFRAYSGRLTYTEGKGCDYCAGQYYATEYRAAACAVLANAIGQAVMDDFNQAKAQNGLALGTARQHLLSYVRRNLGRGIASRWFN